MQNSASESRYRSIFNCVGDAVFIHNKDTGQILEVNDRAVEMYGYSHEEICQLSVKDISLGVPPYTQEEAVAYIRKAGQGRPQQFEWLCRRRDDSLFWTEVSMRSAGLDGEDRVLVLVRDISPRKKVEEDLSTQNKRLDFVLDATKDGIWEINGGDSYFSPQMFSMLGYATPQGDVAEFFKGIVHPDDLQHFESKISSFLRGDHDALWMEFRAKASDGSYHDILSRGKALALDGGTHFIGTHTDISDIKATERALRKNEQRFRSILHSSPMGMYLYELQDEDLILVASNPAADSFTGIENSKLLGKRIEEAFPRLAETEIPNRYREAARNGISWSTTDFRYEDDRITGAYDVHAFQTSPGQMAVFFMDVTQKQQQQQQIKASERSYREIFNASLDAIMLQDLDTGAILDANDRCFQLFAFSKEELLQGGMALFMPEQGEYSVEAAMDKLRHADEGPHMFEWRFINGKQEEIWAEVTLKPTTIGDKHCLLVAIRDVRERKESEAALAVAEAQLMTAIENSPAGIMIADAPNVEMRVANLAALKIYGLQEGDSITGLLDRQTLDFEGAPCSAHDHPLSRAVLHGETCNNKELVLRRADGDERWLWANAAPIRDSSGEIVSGIVVFSDITEQKQAQQALQESRENLRITLNSIGDAVIATDAGGLVERMNPVAEELTGWTVDEARGMALEDIFKIVNAETRAEVENPVRKVMRDGEIVGLANHTVLIDRNGFERQIADSGAPIRDAGGNVVGVVLVFRDVTEDYAIQEQLRHAQKMDSIGQLAGGIAHDFNNMLGGIIGAAELMAMRLGEHETGYKRYVDMILETSGRAAELTQKLLAFSRKGKIKTVPVDINDVISQASGILSHTIDRRIQIEIKSSASAFVMGDPSQLQSAILNLAINARDAMPNGGKLRFSLDRVVLDQDFCERTPFDLMTGHYVELTIADTGLGIPPEHIQRIFEPFFTTKGVGQGTGLGLSAVYGTIKDHGGAITVDSELGQGTAFQLYFPSIHEVDAEQTATHISGSIKGHGRILLIDDESVIRILAAEMLGELGYDVVTADDGESGVQAYREDANGFDLVVLDLVMPRMNGQQTFHAIRGVDPGARILLASGFSLKGGDATNLLDRGAVGFIQKPYRQAELGEAIRAAMRPMKN